MVSAEFHPARHCGRVAWFGLAAMILAVDSTVAPPAPPAPHLSHPITLSTAALPLDHAGFGPVLPADADSDALVAYDGIAQGLVRILDFVETPLELGALLGGFPAETLVGLALSTVNEAVEALVLNTANLLLGSPVPFPVEIPTTPDVGAAGTFAAVEAAIDLDAPADVE